MNTKKFKGTCWKVSDKIYCIKTNFEIISNISIILFKNSKITFIEEFENEIAKVSFGENDEKIGYITKKDLESNFEKITIHETQRAINIHETQRAIKLRADKNIDNNTLIDVLTLFESFQDQTRFQLNEIDNNPILNNIISSALGTNKQTTNSKAKNIARSIYSPLTDPVSSGGGGINAIKTARINGFLPIPALFSNLQSLMLNNPNIKREFGRECWKEAVTKYSSYKSNSINRTQENSDILEKKEKFEEKEKIIIDTPEWKQLDEIKELYKSFPISGKNWKKIYKEWITEGYVDFGPEELFKLAEDIILEENLRVDPNIIIELTKNRKLWKYVEKFIEYNILVPKKQHILTPPDLFNHPSPLRFGIDKASSSIPSSLLFDSKTDTCKIELYPNKSSAIIINLLKDKRIYTKDNKVKAKIREKIIGTPSCASLCLEPRHVLEQCKNIKDIIKYIKKGKLGLYFIIANNIEIPIIKEKNILGIDLGVRYGASWAVTDSETGKVIRFGHILPDNKEELEPYTDFFKRFKKIIFACTRIPKFFRRNSTDKIIKIIEELPNLTFDNSLPHLKDKQKEKIKKIEKDFLSIKKDFLSLEHKEYEEIFNKFQNLIDEIYKFCKELMKIVKHLARRTNEKIKLYKLYKSICAAYSSLYINRKKLSEYKDDDIYQIPTKEFLRDLQREINSLQEDYRRELVAEIIEIADLNKCGVIKIEDLDGYNPNKNRTKSQNKLLSQWGKRAIRNSLKLNCELHGIELVEVPPYYTSQLSSKNGNLGVRVSILTKKVMDAPWWKRKCLKNPKLNDLNEGDFYITKGGEWFLFIDNGQLKKFNADINAAINIARRNPGEYIFCKIDNDGIGYCNGKYNKFTEQENGIFTQELIRGHKKTTVKEKSLIKINDNWKLTYKVIEQEKELINKIFEKENNNKKLFSIEI